MRRFLCCFTAPTVVALIALSTAVSADAATVSPTTFTSTVCAAIDSGAQAVDATSAALSSAASAYKASPSPTTAAAFRDALTQTLQALDTEAGNALAAIDQAGTPTRGTNLVTALKSLLGESQRAAQQLSAQSAAVDVTSASNFGTSMQQLAAAAKAESAKLKTAAKRSAAIRHAVRAYHPLVTFVTTDAKTC